MIIFGASLYGEIAYNILKNEYDIIGFADNDTKKWEQTFNGKRVFSPKELLDIEKLEIIIASQYYSAINAQLYDMGIKDVKVFYYCGNLQLDTVFDKGYELYSITNRNLFEDCIFDKEKVEKVRGNFSENYDLLRNIEKIKLKETNIKRVLFCAYIFPPLGGAGVQRSLKFVKYLRKFGYEPVVLTVGKHSCETGEDFTLLDEIEDVQIVRIDLNKFIPETLSYEEQQEIFNLYAGIMQSEEWMNSYLEIIKSENSLKLIPDNQICWVNDCLKQIEEKVDLSEIDIVYTTGQPFSTYILGYYLKNKYGIKWVQDYRDPWASNDFYIKNFYQNASSTMSLQQQLEKELTRKADKLVVITRALVDEFIKKYGVDEAKIVEITNGYDEADFKDIEYKKSKNKKFTLCYNGCIYGDRNPVLLLQSINKLIEQEQITANEIQWIFNGTIVSEWRKLIDKEDKYNIIQYNGYLSHKDSIQSAMNADILVLFGAEGEGGKIIYSGKIFEYIRMETPILAFSSANGVIDKLLQETKTGQNFEYDDYENVEKYLLKQYKNWKNGDIRFEPDNQEIQKYSRENTTKLLADVFDDLLEKEK